MFPLQSLILVPFLLLDGLRCALTPIDDYSHSDLQAASSTFVKLNEGDAPNSEVSSRFDLLESLPSRASNEGGDGKSRRRQLRFTDDDVSGSKEPLQPKSKSVNEQVKIIDAGESKLGGIDLKKSGTLLKGGDLKKSGSLLRGSLDDDFEGGYDGEKHYDKEAGKKFIEAHKSEAGEDDNKGYQKEEGFDKVQQEKHGKEEKKATVSEKEGEKKGHVQEEKAFGEEYRGKEGEKGVSLKKIGGHKKATKTKGFHKVHHKDEYKKDEVFYDEGHDADEREEHAHEQEKHAQEKGNAAKKASLESGYHQGHGENKATEDKGQKYDEVSGHSKEAGKEQSQNKHSKFGKKSGKKEGRKFGHAEGGGSDSLF